MALLKDAFPARRVRPFGAMPAWMIGKPSELFGEAMVRPSGVEPPLLSEHGPEPCASANSATGAPWIAPGFPRRLGRPEISRPSGVVNGYGALAVSGFDAACASCVLR